jgi:uncharacterized protein (DUF2132 family)
MNTKHPRDPLHGVTLARMLEELVENYGWDQLGMRIPIRCFMLDPSISSSLKFLRRTPWAREKVTNLYLDYKTAKDNQAEAGPAELDGVPPVADESKGVEGAHEASS